MSDNPEKHDDGHGGGHKKGGGSHGPGGGHAEHEESGAPEWLISFADNVALLMGFFVILLAMNMAKPKAGGLGGEGKNPTNEELDFIIGVREAFHQAVDPLGTDPAEAALRKRMKERQLRGETTLAGPSGDKHDVQAPRNSDFNQPAGMLIFADGSAELSDEALSTINDCADLFRGARHIIDIRGHASAAEAMRDEEKGLRLGYERALATARALARAGIEWERVRLVACGDNDSAVQRPRTNEGHRTNQRVEIFSTAAIISDNPFAETSAGEDH